MEYEYKIIDKGEMTLLCLSQTISVSDNEAIFKFFDGIVEDGSYHKLFSSQKENSGEWNIYTSDEKMRENGQYLLMTGTEYSNTELSKLHGMKVEVMVIKPAKWLTIKVHSHEEMGKVHKRTLEDNCIKEIGYKLDFDFQKPIMEFQPVACTKTPPYLEYWMPVTKL